MSKLLIEEPPLQVLPTLATAIGLNEAIVLQQVHYWLNSFMTTRHERHFKYGKWWVYNSYEQWQEDNFPFWSVSTVRRVIVSLEERGLLIGKQLEKHNWQRRKWYTIDYDKLHELEQMPRSAQNEQNDTTQDEQIDNPQPEQINTETTQETTTESPLAVANAPQAPRFAVGDVVELDDDIPFGPTFAVVTLVQANAHGVSYFVREFGADGDSGPFYDGDLHIANDPPTPPDPPAAALPMPDDPPEDATGDDDGPDWNEVKQAFLDTGWFGNGRINYAVNMNFGRATKGDWKDGNLDEPLTPDEIKKFVQWYRKPKDNGGAGKGDCPLPTSPGVFRDNVEAFRRQLAEFEARSRAAVADPDDFEPPTLTPTVSYAAERVAA